MKKTLLSVVILSLVLLMSQSVGAQMVGLRSNLFDSNSASLDSLFIPGASGEVTGLATINFKANKDLYVTLKGAVGKEFDFLSELDFSGMIEATYLFNDKLAFNLHLDNAGEISAMAEYYILSKNNFDLAAQLGLGYGKAAYIGGFFVGADLLASYDVLSNLNISASVGLDYSFDGSRLYIVDEVKVNYVPIKYADITLSYQRLDGISTNDAANTSYDALRLVVGTGIKKNNYSNYKSENDKYNSTAFDNSSSNDYTTSNPLMNSAYDYMINPNDYYNSVAINDKLSVNYNVDYRVSNLLVKNSAIVDSLEITAGAELDLKNNFDLSLFATGILNNMIENSAFDFHMFFNIGLGYKINNSFKVSLDSTLYLSSLLSSVDPRLFVVPSIEYVVNDNMNISLSYIADHDFTNPDAIKFTNIVKLGAELKF